MPRYDYRCTKCNELSTISHLSDELSIECPKCGDPHGLVKLVTTFRTKGNARSFAKTKTGQVTEEFIQEARQDLSQHKQELDKNR